MIIFDKINLSKKLVKHRRKNVIINNSSSHITTTFKYSLSGV